jgi:uncharacterized coiled-coil DUF342 family protein
MDRMDKVMELYFKSVPTKVIQQQLNLTRAQVLDTVDEWKKYAMSSRTLTDRAAEVVHQADGHFGQIIDSAWAVADTADQAGELRNQISALSLAASTEEKRVKMLKDAGILDNLELANQVAETEDKAEKIVAILKEVTADCDHCREEVRRRLNNINGFAEPIKVIKVEQD